MGLGSVYLKLDVVEVGVGMLVPNHIVWNNNTNPGMSENNTVCFDFTPKKRVTSATSNKPQYFT